MAARAYSLNCITGMLDYYLFFLKIKSKKRKDSQMTKINLIAVMISILFQLNANAGTVCKTKTPYADTYAYSFELMQEDNGNLVLVKFTIPEDCFVNIKVTDIEGNAIQELVQDEMPAGNYNVYYSIPGKYFNDKDKCTMKVYKTHDDLKEAVYTKEIILSGKIKFNTNKCEFRGNI